MKFAKKIIRKIFDFHFSIKYWFRKNLHNKLSKKRNILLVTYYEAYDEHIINYYDSLDDKDKKKFYLSYGRVGIKDYKNTQKAKKIIEGRNIKIIGNGFWNGLKLLLKSWDLVVLPEHLPCYTAIMKNVPSLFIYHGISAIFENNETFYVYRKEFCMLDGMCKYSFMLENNKYLADFMNTKQEFAGIVKYASSPVCDKVIDEVENRDKYRSEFGLSKDDLFVFVYSTWNDNSLFYKLGRDFLNQIKTIKSACGKRVVFALSPHPKEYTNYRNDDKKPLGEFIEEYFGGDVLIRRPGEDWIPYIISADFVIGDQSTMLYYSILADKKVILSETDFEIFHKLSVPGLAYRNLPILHKEDYLLQVLEKYIQDYDMNKIKEIKDILVPEKGFYKKTINSLTNELLKIKK